MASNNLPDHPNSSIFLDQDLIPSNNFANGNNTFVYNFPKTVWTTDETKMSLSNFSVPFSWYNITKAQKNNQFGYVWYDGATTFPTIVSGNSNFGKYFPVNIPDGYYTIETLNSYLQYQMIQDGNFMIDNNGNYVYFLEFIINPTTYRVQLNSYQLPLTLPAGWVSVPAAATATHPAIRISLASTAPNNLQPFPLPQIVLFPSDSATTPGLFTFFGFSLSQGTAYLGAYVPMKGSYVFPGFGSNNGNAVIPLAQFNLLAQYPPLIDQVHSICLTCNYVDNPLRSTQEHQVSTRVLTTQSVTVPFGNKITNTNFFTTWIPLIQNINVSKLIFQLTDQEGAPLLLQDADTNIEILITNLKY